MNIEVEIKMLKENVKNILKSLDFYNANNDKGISKNANKIDDVSITSINALCEVAEAGDENNTNVEEALCDLAEAVDGVVAEIEEALCDLAEANEMEV